MNNKAKNMIILVLSIVLIVQFYISSIQTSKQNSEISALNSALVEFDDLRSKRDEQEAYIANRGKEGMELIDKLANIDSLEQLIDEYQPRMDGAVSEGYGHKIAELTQKESLKSLIFILSDKDIGVTNQVSYLLFCEYLIEDNLKAVELLIRELESINSIKLSDKEKAIIFSLLKEAYSSKNEIKVKEKQLKNS
jgi:hypothetical protein